MSDNGPARLHHREGFRRLSLTCGLFGMGLWAFLSFLEVFDYMRHDNFFIGLGFSFFLPFGALRAIPWIIAGFYAEKEETKSRFRKRLSNFIRGKGFKA